MKSNLPGKIEGIKANSLLCPFCYVEYEEVEFDFEVDGVILNNVKACRCPSCKDEIFTAEQHEAIRKRIQI